MCDRAGFEKIRDSIGELQRANASQNEQPKTLFNITERSEPRKWSRFSACRTRA